MIQRSSRTTSLLGSSLNSSQLSLYSHASSRSAGNSSHYDSRTEAGNRPTRVSSGGQAQASRFVSGNGYLTSSRTPNGAKSQSKTKRMISEARERRKQERRKTHIHVHALAEEKSLDGATGVNGDLESYLMSFSQDVEGGGKATKTKGKSVLPRGSELDWDKLLESGDSLNGTQSDDDNVFEDHSDLDGSALLKRSMKMDSADPPPGSHIEQTMDRLRKTSIISSDIKFLDENSSPNVNDIVLTDSLDGSSSSTHAPMATDRLRQAHVHTRNLLSDSDRGLESNALGDIRKAADLNSSNDIDINAAQSSDRSKPVTMRNLGGASLNPPDDSVTISEEQSISELFDFKQNVTSSIDLLEADINELHDQSEESSFEQNLYDVHSLRELEELEDRPSHSDKAITKLSAGRGRGENTLTTKTSASTKREQSPFQSPPLKPKLSGFKFSAATTTLEEISTNQHKVVSYSSDEFESESVSEVESMAGSNDSGEEIEESVASHSGGEMAESVASNLDDSDDDRTEERGGGGGREHSELSYSSFSEAEQKDKSELTESQQMEQFVSHTSIRPPNTFKEHSEVPKPSTTGASVQRDACVQTEPLTSSQPIGYPSVTIGCQYGKEYLDPSPILPHVISPDALEVVTGYSPSVVALTDMLRTQLSITKNLVAHTRQLATSVSNSITPNYHYTTLEETKQYIARHRPKLICFEEARKLVQLEHQ